MGPPLPNVALSRRRRCCDSVVIGVTVVAFVLSSLRRVAAGYHGGVPMDVMVVEDDAVLRELLSLHLATHGHRVRSAASGEDALAQCARSVPDIVVLDLSLPCQS